MVRHHVFPQKSPGSRRLWFLRTRVQHFPGSSTIELPSNLAEFGAYPSDRALPDSPRQPPLPLACHHLPKGTTLELGRGAHLGNTIILNQSYRRRVSTDRLNNEDKAIWLYLSMVRPVLHPPEKPSHTYTPKPGFGGRGHEVNYIVSEARENNSD